MKINITPNTDQIRFYAQSALNVWGALPEQLAKENVIADMTALLNYLDACENGSGRVVLGVSKIERGIRLKVSWADPQIVDLTDRYADDRDAPARPVDHEVPALSDVQDVRSHGDGRPADLELNLAPLTQSGT